AGKTEGEISLAHGTLKVNNDGTVTYTSKDRFVGEETFTYTVTDNDGILSNPATVTITVNNAPPTITSTNIPENIIEGISTTISAIALDAGKDELTYTWNFGDNTESSTGESVNHTYTQNGTYNATLTVNDSHGGEIAHQIAIAVANATPIVSAGFDLTVNEGTNITLNGSFTDSGINDTHNTEWNFGDGTTITNNLQPTHTYADNGTYTATLTVTDSDNAVASDTTTITVLNVAPAIASLTGDTEISEGDTATFSAIATDPGNDTLTYIWDFGDGTEGATGTEVTHAYTDNGNYTVTLTVTDSDGAATAKTHSIAVNNIAPTINSLTGDTNLDEGETGLFNASAIDPGNDELTYTWNFGDDTETVTGNEVNHTYAQNGTYNTTLTVTDDDGAETTQTLTIEVFNVAPTVNAGDSQTTSEGQTVQFNATFNDPGILDTHTITWDFGDGSTTADTLNPTHTYTTEGTYTVTITVTDSDGAATNASVIVTVNNAAPVINALTGDTNVKEGDTATFSINATDPGNDPLTITWDFGDGTDPVSGENVTHVFNNNGNYTVTVTVTDDEGVATTSSMDVTVTNVAPTITNITGDTNTNEGTAANFSAIATDPSNDTLTYTWNFGDGTDPIEGQNVTHIFTQNGNYTVNLTVTDSDGASATSNLDVTVNNVAPTITNLTGDTEATEGDTNNFSVSAIDPGNDNLTYTWNLGDGSDTLAGENVSHTFVDDGTYNTTVTVTDDHGAAITQILTVTVLNAAPVVNAGENQTTNEGTAITFNGSYTDPGAIDTHTINWDFGDGNTNTETLTPTHTYTQNGTYTVTLTVTDNYGDATASTRTVVVDNVAPVVASITGDTNVNEGETANFGAIATDSGNDTLTYTWNFGDDTDEVEGSDVSHIYTNNGNYTVTLIVTDSDGASTTSSLNVIVNNVTPTIKNVSGDTTVSEGDTGSYNVTAIDPSNDTLTYTWNFGDGTQPVEGENVTHTWVQEGNYNATVTVTDSDGATITQTEAIAVSNLAPVVNAGENQTTNEGQSVEFNATFNDPGILDTHTVAWDFGDGSTTTDALNPTHTYTQNGIYTASLTVTDNAGAATEATVQVTVLNVAPTINTLTGDTNVNEGETANFTAEAIDPGNDTLTYTWNFGDDTEEVEGSNVSHIFSNNGNYTVTLTVTDSDGATTTNTIDVTVSNVAPAIESIDIESDISEGTDASFSATATEKGSDTLTYTWDFGDASDPIEGQSVSHTFTNNGTYSIVLTVTDSDGASTSQTTEVTVKNVTPTITNITGDTDVLEGDTANFSAIATDKGNDTLTYTWNFGDESEPIIGKDVSHVFTQNGNYTVTLTVTDSDGAETKQTIDVTVDNVTPTITTITGDTNVSEG
ncbi:PKD domain-containing protein, partial [Chroococcidiopsis sp.]|uniref:PKD domain-containing protein n=1 Tax=Chroococcidiopsis sp. TaxID=3088168 RepID=UPI003F309346